MPSRPQRSGDLDRDEAHADAAQLTRRAVSCVLRQEQRGPDDAGLYEVGYPWIGPRHPPLSLLAYAASFARSCGRCRSTGVPFGMIPVGFTFWIE
jgi:hypothetical protein